MTTQWLVLILATLGGAALVLIWLMVRQSRTGRPGKAGKHLTAAVQEAKVAKHPDAPIQSAVDREIEHVFTADFREELRNRGRLKFEKIISENAMFLQQDLQLTTSQLNDYMKAEIINKLKTEFDKYEQSIADAKQLAIESIEKTSDAIDEQRKLLNQQLQQEYKTEKQQLIKRFEDNMADIVNHYVLEAVGNQIDLDDQLDYILADLETNKAAILEDINNGA